MLRGSAAAIVVATFLAASAFGATAIRGRNATRKADSSAVPVASPSASQPEVKPVAPVKVAAIDSSAKAAPSVAPAAPIAPNIPAGESILLDGITASRTDGVVTVSFDIPMIRTRIPDKFERFVRSTLPQIYGAAIDSSLAKLPIGSIAQQGNLVTELPSRGIRIPIAPAWEVRVLPVIRPGLEGPIVVKYRTMVCGAAQTECGVR